MIYIVINNVLVIVYKNKSFHLNTINAKFRIIQKLLENFEQVISN